MKPTGILRCKANTDTDSRLDGVDVINNNPNMSDILIQNKHDPF